MVAGQYGSVLGAIKGKKEIFTFDEEEIALIPTVGAFITMNPGYAGRTELPENLKALFRPCAMVVPNFENIAEVNLAGEGFVESKVLANKERAAAPRAHVAAPRARCCATRSWLRRAVGGRARCSRDVRALLRHARAAARR